MIDVMATLVELFELGSVELPGRSLMRDEGDRMVVSQIGRRPGRRWRSIRVGSGEIHELPNGRSKTLGFRGAGVDAPHAVAQGAQTEIDEAAALLEELAPWPKPRRGGARLTEEERRNLEALGYGE